MSLLYHSTGWRAVTLLFPLPCHEGNRRRDGILIRTRKVEPKEKEQANMELGLRFICPQGSLERLIQELSPRDCIA